MTSRRSRTTARGDNEDDEEKLLGNTVASFECNLVEEMIEGRINIAALRESPKAAITLLLLPLVVLVVPLPVDDRSRAVRPKAPIPPPPRERNASSKSLLLTDVECGTVGGEVCIGLE